MPTYAPERLASRGVNLSDRIVASNTVAASPAGATETTICTVQIPAGVQVFSKVILQGQAAFTIGTSGDHYTLKIRQTDTSGTTLYSSGTIAGSAAALINTGALGVDTSPGTNGQVYVLTLTIANGAASSTVSNCTLKAEVI